MTAFPTYEGGNTVQFTWVSSVAPDNAPRFSVTGLDGTVLASVTAITSDSTHYYAMYTPPESDETYYRTEWYATKTVQGSAYQFKRKSAFKVNVPDFAT